MKKGKEKTSTINYDISCVMTGKGSTEIKTWNRYILANPWPIYIKQKAYEEEEEEREMRKFMKEQIDLKSWSFSSFSPPNEPKSTT